MILLDDSQSTVSNPTSRLYQDPIQYWCIYPRAKPEENEAAIQQVFKELTQATTRGEYLVTALAYE